MQHAKTLHKQQQILTQHYNAQQSTTEHNIIQQNMIKQENAKTRQEQSNFPPGGKINKIMTVR